MSGGRGAGESRVWRKVIAGVRVGEMSHPQNKFRILSVEILSQQRDILSCIWMPAHFLPTVSLSDAIMHSGHCLLLMLWHQSLQKIWGIYDTQHPPIKILEEIHPVHPPHRWPCLQGHAIQRERAVLSMCWTRLIEQCETGTGATSDQRLHLLTGPALSSWHCRWLAICFQ